MKTLALAVLTSVLMCSACVVEHDDSGPPPNGTLVVDWTIDGTTDPAKCSQSESDSINVAVTDSNGDNIGNFQ